MRCSGRDWEENNDIASFLWWSWDPLPSEKGKAQSCFISNLMSRYRKITFLTEGRRDLPKHSTRWERQKYNYMSMWLAENTAASSMCFLFCFFWRGKVVLQYTRCWKTRAWKNSLAEKTNRKNRSCSGYVEIICKTVKYHKTVVYFTKDFLGWTNSCWSQWNVLVWAFFLSHSNKTL